MQDDIFVSYGSLCIMLRNVVPRVEEVDFRKIRVVDSVGMYI